MPALVPPLVLSARNHAFRPSDVNTLLVDGSHNAELDASNRVQTGDFMLVKEAKGGIIIIAVNSVGAGIITTIEAMVKSTINGVDTYTVIAQFAGLNINAARAWTYQMHWTAAQGQYDGVLQVALPNVGALRITQVNNIDAINYRVDLHAQD